MFYRNSLLPISIGHKTTNLTSQPDNNCSQQLKREIANRTSDSHRNALFFQEMLEVRYVQLTEMEQAGG
jgi:hypothetical protein